MARAATQRSAARGGMRAALAGAAFTASALLLTLGMCVLLTLPIVLCKQCWPRAGSVLQRATQLMWYRSIGGLALLLFYSRSLRSTAAERGDGAAARGPQYLLHVHGPPSHHAAVAGGGLPVAVHSLLSGAATDDAVASYLDGLHAAAQVTRVLQALPLRIPRAAGAWLSGMVEPMLRTTMAANAAWRPSRELPPQALVLANHPTQLDPFLLAPALDALGCLPGMCTVLKAELRRVPLLGWGCRLFEYIFLERRAEVDTATLRAAGQRLAASTTAGHTLLFPEGTVLWPSTIARSTAYGAKARWPPLRHLLQPRVKALQELLACNARITTVLDVTLTYAPANTGDTRDTGGTGGTGWEQDKEGPLAYLHGAGLMHMAWHTGVLPHTVHVDVRYLDAASFRADTEHQLLRLWRDKDAIIAWRLAGSSGTPPAVLGGHAQAQAKTEAEAEAEGSSEQLLFPEDDSPDAEPELELEPEVEPAMEPEVEAQLGTATASSSRPAATAASGDQGAAPRAREQVQVQDEGRRVMAHVYHTAAMLAAVGPWRAAWAAWRAWWEGRGAAGDGSRGPAPGSACDADPLQQAEQAAATSSASYAMRMQRPGLATVTVAIAVMLAAEMQPASLLLAALSAACAVLLPLATDRCRRILRQLRGPGHDRRGPVTPWGAPWDALACAVWLLLLLWRWAWQAPLLVAAWTTANVACYMLPLL